MAGVSLCGALKNIVAVAAGFIDGLEYGNNSKAAIMRIGLLEMNLFCKEFFEGVKDETFLIESAGVADVITSCKSVPVIIPPVSRIRADSIGLGGRNRKVAEAYVTKKKVCSISLLLAASLAPSFMRRSRTALIEL